MENKIPSPVMIAGIRLAKIAVFGGVSAVSVLVLQMISESSIPEPMIPCFTAAITALVAFIEKWAKEEKKKAEGGN